MPSELTDYLLQERALVDVETELAGALGLTAARDSLARAAAGLRIVDYRLPKLFIEERMFLEYEPDRVSSSRRPNTMPRTTFRR